MQTFLPYASFRRSAQALDDKRLGKQRVEAFQILRTLYGVNDGWKNHPAVKMWRGYEGALSAYYNWCILEWTRRGFKNNMLRCAITVSDVKLPPWFGGKIHKSHRIALNYKALQQFQLKHNRSMLDWYEQFAFESVPDQYMQDLYSDKSFPGYYWPVR